VALAPIRGSINDREINYYPVDGADQFSTEISGTAGVSFSGLLKATQVRNLGFMRSDITLPSHITKLTYVHSIKGASAVQLPTHVFVNYVFTMGGHSEVGVEGELEATLAYTLGGLSESAFLGLGEVNSYISFVGTMDTGFELNGTFERTFFSRWKIVRRITVPFGAGRRLSLQAEYRRIVVADDLATLARQKEDVIK